MIKDLGGRPSMLPADKKRRLSVTVPPEMFEFLDGVPNRSHYVTAAVEFYRRFQEESKYLNLRELNND